MTKGRPVVAYDLDPQQTLADVAEVRMEEGGTPPLQVYLNQDELSKQLRYHPAEVLVDVGCANLEAMKQAISVAHRVLIPVPPSQPDVWATQRFLGIVKEAVERNDIEPPELMAFVNRSDTHHAVRESDETAEVLQQIEGIKVLPKRLYNRTIFRRSFSEGMAVFELWQGCKAAKEFDEFASALYPALATKNS